MTTPSQARLNRQIRARKMKENNPKRQAAIDKLKKRLATEKERRQAEKDKIQKDKEFIRNEKRKIREDQRRERSKLANERRKLMQEKKARKTVVACSSEKAGDLSTAMARLVLSSAQISTLSHAQYVKVRADMSKLLSAIREYAKRCNRQFVAPGRKKAYKSPTAPLRIPNRQIFIPDIGVAVPDKCPVTEQEFNKARHRIEKRQQSTQRVQYAPPKKNKKRIAPTLVRGL